MKLSLILILFLLYFNNCSAQITQDDPVAERIIFRKQLDQQKITYNVPDGYEQLYRPHNAMIGPILLSGSRHQLRALKDSIFIYFSIDVVDTTMAYFNIMKKFGFIHNTNENYLKTRSDTLKYPITRNSLMVTRKKYNADVSGYYDLPLEGRYINQYGKCRVAFIHKENRADITLYFFYTPASAASVEKHMKKVLKKIEFTG
ncbi:hypothetical protein ACVWYN_000488 [Pedobacter sp. UYP24]